MEPTRILVVDDEPLIRLSLSRMLRHRGFEVSVAETGRCALQHLETHTIDVVLTDIMMPDIDGVTVLHQVHREHPEVCLIAMSAHDGLCQPRC